MFDILVLLSVLVFKDMNIRINMKFGFSRLRCAKHGKNNKKSDETQRER